MAAKSQKQTELLAPKMNHATYAVGSFDADVKATLKDLQSKNFVRRLWAQDASLWHQDPAHQTIIRNALGWLFVSKQQIRHVSRLQAFAEDVKNAGFTHLLLLGMGGSSLCPEVCRMTFGVRQGYPDLHVLDSTVPSQVKSFEARLDLERTLCIVASKSGSTTEPLVFQKYFFERMRRIKGDRAGENFIAITDPGSLLERMAQELQFRAIFPGVLDIGGRYSALSNFGMVPAATMGVNVEQLLSRAEQMLRHCDSTVPTPDNPGVVLGVILATAAKAGHDKVTFIASPAISDLGAWLEQLIAESMGKEGKGLIPVDDEPLGVPPVYGNDRVFAYLRYTDGADPAQDAGVEALQVAGHPVVRIDVTNLMNLGQEFFRWEVATATAGSLLEVNAFDQPNVQESKDFTKAYLEEFKKKGCLPEDSPIIEDRDVRIFADAANQRALGRASSLEQIVSGHLASVHVGDYVAINAYLERTPVVHAIFQQIRTLIRDAKQVPTTLGYGPRFLHSTGQLHKGGPNTGVFIQVTADQRADLEIPGEPYSFGILVTAQALGDMKSLSARNRRVIRIHLGLDIEGGLRRIQQAVEKVLHLKTERLPRVRHDISLDNIVPSDEFWEGIKDKLTSAAFHIEIPTVSIDLSLRKKIDKAVNRLTDIKLLDILTDSNISGALNNAIQSMVAGSATVFDKAMDANYLATSIGGGNHRQFDGGHTFKGAWDAVSGLDLGFLDTLKGYTEALLKDMSTPRGLPIITWDCDIYNKVASAIEKIGISKTNLINLNHYTTADLLAGTVASVGLILHWSSSDTKKFAAIIATLSVNTFANMNAVTAITTVVALGALFTKSKKQSKKIVEGLMEGGIGSVVTLLAMAALSNAPGAVVLTTGVITSILVNQSMQTQFFKERQKSMLSIMQ